MNIGWFRWSMLGGSCGQAIFKHDNVVLGIMKKKKKCVNSAVYALPSKKKNLYWALLEQNRFYCRGTTAPVLFLFLFFFRFGGIQN